MYMQAKQLRRYTSILIATDFYIYSFAGKHSLKMFKNYFYAHVGNVDFELSLQPLQGQSCLHRLFVLGSTANVIVRHRQHKVNMNC